MSVPAGSKIANGVKVWCLEQLSVYLEDPSSHLILSKSFFLLVDKVHKEKTRPRQSQIVEFQHSYLSFQKSSEIC